MDKRQFRDCLGCFPTGVTVVTAVGPDGLLGVTVNSFNSVSLDPPLILFCLDRGIRSLAGFEAARHHAVNVLDIEQGDLARRFASASDDKWAGLEVSHGETGCPVFDDAMAVMECAAHERHDGGDHVIFVGRVVAMRARLNARPLVFHRGRYAGLMRDLEGTR